MPATAEAPLVRERKFVSDRADPLVAVALLRAWAAPDPQFPEGELESVYFDTPGFDAWRQKANGDAVKRKVRLRWYRGSAPSGRRAVWLEVKDRIGSARDKIRHRAECDVDWIESAPLSDSGWAELLARLASDSGFPLGDGLLPTVAIRYRRSRLVCPATGSRLSVDRAISCPRANDALLPFAGPLDSPCTVVEAKSADVWDWPFGESLSRMGFRMESFSKYGYFLERILQGGFR
jgi:hypothetical protein